MKVHVVTAHPETRSFNFALRCLAVETLQGEGHEVQCSDLYQDGFAASAGPGDFEQPQRAGSWQLASAQLDHAKHGGFVCEIRREQERVLWSDLTILQFPIWWGSYPAILKGWIDRVLSYGFAYGRARTLSPRAAMYSVTTGGAADEAEAVEYRERVQGLAEDVFGYLGWQVLPPSICHGPADSRAEARQQMLDDFESHLRKEVVVMEVPIVGA
ncbi:MAG: NAD(P)H-dependent oxidoreductase, partial [Acidobacteriota bacterium]